MRRGIVPNTAIDRLTSTNAIAGGVIALLVLADQVGHVLAPVTLLLPRQYQAYVAPILLLGALLLIVRAFLFSRPTRSRLLRPEALRLQRDNQRHLIGRQEEIDQVIELITRSPLLFVEGESGVGKSALLGSGVAPKLATDGTLLPIYIESLSGPDWDEDAWRLLFHSILRTIPPAERTVLGLSGVPEPGKRKAALASLQSATARTPLIIVDQFDDYQVRHWHRFHNSGSWTKSAEVLEANSFWRALSELLAATKLHLAIVTRSDAGLGLESIRFVEPETFTVPRLERHYIGNLLDSITRSDGEGGAVIENPEAGWTLLRDRLVDDLGRTGAILPQQLKISLLGLATLPHQVLSVGAYERGGRTVGLEADWIKARIKRAEQAEGLPEDQTLRVLTALIDPDEPRKTRELSIDALADQAHIADKDRQSFTASLGQLEQDEVIRRRRDPGEGYERWRLDHDYLTSVVREAHRRANFWTSKLKEGRDSLAAASGQVRRRWNALLSPRTQLQFLVDRLRGRFQYGQFRGYAAKSTARFVPFVVVAAAAIVGIGYFNQQEKNRRFVESVVAPLREDAELDTPETTAVLELTLADQASVDGTVAKLASSDVYIQRLRANISPLSRAMQWRSNPRYGELAANRLMGALNRNTDDPQTINNLVTTLGAVGERLTPQQGTEAARVIIAAMHYRPDDPGFLARAAGALGALRERLPVSEADQAAGLLLARLDRGMSNGNPTFALTRGIDELKDRISSAQATAIASRLLSLIEENPSESLFATYVLPEISDRLYSPQLTNVALRLLTTIEHAPDQVSLSVALGEVLSRSATRIDRGHASNIARRILLVLDNPRVSYQLLGAAAALFKRLPRSQQSEIVAVFTVKLDNVPDANLSIIGHELGLFEDALPPDLAMKATRVILGAMSRNNQDSLELLAEALDNFGDNVPRAQAEQAADILIAEIGRVPGGLSQATYWEALAPLARRLPPERVSQLVPRLWWAMDQESDDSVLAILGSAFGPLAEGLPPAQAARLRTAIERDLPLTARPPLCAAYNLAAVLLGNHLSHEQQVERIFQALSDPLAVGATDGVLERLARIAGREFKGEVDAYWWLIHEQSQGRLRSVNLEIIGSRMRGIAETRLAVLQAHPLQNLRSEPMQ
jgi:hypothetical protein